MTAPLAKQCDELRRIIAQEAAAKRNTKGLMQLLRDRRTRQLRAEVRKGKRK